MAFTTTTLSAALNDTDVQMSVTSATGFAAGDLCKVDQEIVRISKSYTSGTIVLLDGRGLSGGVVSTHPSGANVETTATATDWANATPQGVVPYPVTSPGRTITSYSAAGAIALPTAGNDATAIINGTNALAMTLANPTKDMDGSLLRIASNGKAAHTVTYTAGLGNAGSGYTVATFTTGSQQVLALMAINGIWVQAQSQFSGTLTAILIALA